MLLLLWAPGLCYTVSALVDGPFSVLSRKYRRNAPLQVLRSDRAVAFSRRGYVRFDPQSTFYRQTEIDSQNRQTHVSTINLLN